MGVHTCAVIRGFLVALGWLGTDLRSHRSGGLVLGWIAKSFGFQRNGGLYFGAGLGRLEGSLRNEEFLWGDGEELWSQGLVMGRCSVL